MLITLRGSRKNINSIGQFTWGLDETFDVDSVELVSTRIVGNLSVPLGASVIDWGMKPYLYAEIMEGIETDCYIMSNMDDGADLLIRNSIPIGEIKNYSDETEAHKNEIMLCERPQKVNKKIVIALFEIVNGVKTIANINAILTDTAPTPLSNLGVDFVFRFKVCSHNQETINTSITPERTYTYKFLLQGGTTYVLSKFDSFGDGWNAGNVKIFSSVDNVLVRTSTMITGSSEIDNPFILAGDSTTKYNVVVFAGSYPSELSWRINIGSTTGPFVGEGGPYTGTGGPFGGP